MKTLSIVILLFMSFNALALSKSFFPSDNLLKYVFKRLDLTTFRNSTGPQRQTNQRYFSELGYSLVNSRDDELVIESDNWIFTIKVLSQRDINNDGLEDLEICILDKSKTSTYFTQEPLLLTQYSETSDLIALSFETDGCESFAKYKNC